MNLLVAKNRDPPKNTEVTDGWMDYYKDTESWEDAADSLGTKELPRLSLPQPRASVSSFISGSPPPPPIHGVLFNK